MSRPSGKVWSITRREILESQQKHALTNRFLRTLLCSNDNFNPGYNREMFMRKRTSILDEFVLFMNCCSIQYNAALEEIVNVAQEVNALCKNFLVFSHFEIGFSILEIRVASIASYEKGHLICIILNFDEYFSPTIVNCSF